MPEEVSANLSMPLLMPSQAQKHVTHNEALMVLDALVQLTVLDRDLIVPPSSPVEGERHIISAVAAGFWGGPADTIAVFTNGAWAFYEPRPGWKAYVLAESRTVVWQDETWQDVFAALDAVERLGINATADNANRLVVASTATLLSHDGAGHHLKINKATATDTASLLFQDNWSGRAEMGLAGNDDFSIKVSPDGSAWAEALRIAATTGKGLFGHGLQVQGDITGTSVTQSATDTTAGRLLKVGDFGLGTPGSPPQVSNLNSIAAPGFYRIEALDAVAGNAPVAAACEIVHTQISTTSAVQIAWCAEVNDVRHWERKKSGGAWQAWSLFFHRGNIVGPVSLSGGVPTGSIAERGSNSNGNYLRLADGTLWCWQAVIDTAASWATTAGALYRRSSPLSWTYPAAFVSAPFVTGASHYGDDLLTGCSLRSSPATGNTLFLPWTTTPIASGNVKTVFMFAVGRWI